MYRSCSLLFKNEDLPDGNYEIDPDGTGPVHPFNVWCTRVDDVGEFCTVVLSCCFKIKCIALHYIIKHCSTIATKAGHVLKLPSHPFNKHATLVLRRQHEI